MIIAKSYSHNDGKAYIEKHYPKELDEIRSVIAEIKAENCKLKKPKEKEIARAKRADVTHFYSPPHINALFDYYLFNLGWDIKPRIKTNDPSREGYREMDALKGKLGVEIQMGKYSFLTYDIVAKMVIFRNYNIIDCGIEICPMASMLPYMSSGIGAFEQAVWDLSERRVADIDIPVLLIGIESEHMPTRANPKGRASMKKQDQPSLLNLNLVSRPGTLPDKRGIIYLKRYPKKPTESTLRKVRESGVKVD